MEIHGAIRADQLVPFLERYIQQQPTKNAAYEISNTNSFFNIFFHVLLSLSMDFKPGWKGQMCCFSQLNCQILTTILVII